MCFLGLLYYNYGFIIFLLIKNKKKNLWVFFENSLIKSIYGKINIYAFLSDQNKKKK